jgi:hypothetical protein
LESGFIGGKSGNLNELYWDVREYGQIPFVSNDTKLAFAPGIDPIDLFSREIDSVSTVKNCRKAALEDIYELLGRLMKNPGASSWVSSLDRKFIILAWAILQSEDIKTHVLSYNVPQQTAGYGPRPSNQRENTGIERKD